MSSEKRRVRILDTTLRDGEQNPGVSLTVDDKVEIAKALDRLGVDVIEAGFPVVSEGELASVKAINKLGLTSQVCALSRVDTSDVDSVISCGIEYAHLFVATSDLHLKYKLKLTREQALEAAVRGVEYARAHGIRVEFSAEDATRSDRELAGAPVAKQHSQREPQRRHRLPAISRRCEHLRPRRQRAAHAMAAQACAGRRRVGPTRATAAARNARQARRRASPAAASCRSRDSGGTSGPPPPRRWHRRGCPWARRPSGASARPRMRVRWRRAAARRRRAGEGGGCSFASGRRARAIRLRAWRQRERPPV